MQEYRLFFFDSGGRLLAAHEVLAADDARAVARAERRVNNRHAELWQRDRKVRRWGGALERFLPEQTESWLLLQSHLGGPRIEPPSLSSARCAASSGSFSVSRWDILPQRR